MTASGEVYTSRFIQRIVLLLIGICVSSAVWSQATNEIPWMERPWQDRAYKGTYEDKFTGKHRQTFFADPFVWAYSQEFADKFRMPQQWVDPELQGAMAVAWRMTTISQKMCGLGGRADNCWPQLTCQMDIYFDDTTPLPWRKDIDDRANFVRGLMSTDYLPTLTSNSPSVRYEASGSRKKPLLNDAFKYADAIYTISGATLMYYDKQIEPGVMLVGYVDVCPSETSIKAAELRFFSVEENERTRGSIKNFAHRVYFSENFMKKISGIFVEADKAAKEKRKSLVEDFKNIMK